MSTQLEKLDVVDGAADEIEQLAEERKRPLVKPVQKLSAEKIVRNGTA